jgi:prephenate dehydratase
MKIVFQGEPGANSHIACKEAYPDAEPVPCATFEDAFQLIEDGSADLGMIPIENSVAGRVADIHHLLPTSPLHITGEHFLPIHHQLVAVKGTTLDQVKSAQSHVMALGQCRKFLREHRLEAVIGADTAGSARQIAERKDPSQAAIASSLAAEVYGLDVLAEDIEDEDHNTTRFITLAREPITLPAGNGPCRDGLHFSRAQRVGRLVQGVVRVCHQFGQHDQAGELSDRRAVFCLTVLR